MSLLLALGSSGSTTPQRIYPEDVFSSYVTIGTGASLNVTTNVDLATNGGAIFRKGRSGATDWAVYSTTRGVTKDLVFNSTAAETTQAQGLTAISTSGHTWGTLAKVNTNLATYVDLVFRNAIKFFYETTKVHTNGVASTVDLAILSVVGKVVIKSTVGTSNWFTWHKDLTAGNNLKLNLTDAESATNAYLSVSGTVLTIASTAPSDTYEILAWAHDTGTDGFIKCGSFTTDGSGNATISLGWELQYCELKAYTTTGDWITVDAIRGMPVGNTDQQLYLNLSNAETAGATLDPTATGFKATGLTASQSYVYMAIRRPMKTPTSGTQIYNAVARTGTGAIATVSGAGFPVDLSITKKRSAVTLTGARFVDRLRGKTKHLDSSALTAEVTTATTVTGLDSMDGIFLGSDATTSAFNTNTHTYIDYFIKRASGVFDAVCYDGTGVAKTESHNLTVVPEFIIIKNRVSSAFSWIVLWNFTATTYDRILLNTTDIPNLNNLYSSALMLSAIPTSTTFSVGTNGAVNTSPNTYVAYLFATLAGISKFGTYTGNGTSLTIDCGFTTGARFVLIIRTDSTSDRYIWDTVRGIIAGNDPHISLNTTAAEVTTDDSIDPDASGFIVNQDAATNINVNAASYIYFALS